MRDHANLTFAVCRIRTTFKDTKGEIAGVGTGFWVDLVERGPAFVTCKHNVDRSFLTPERPDLALTKVEIEVRPWDGVSVGERAFSEANDFKSCLRLSKTADCAALLDPKFEAMPPGKGVPNAFSQGDVAPLDWYAGPPTRSNTLTIADTVYFLGFPGSGKEPWVDAKHGLPIARTGILASWPGIPFEHKDIKTSDALVVSGMSFSGSSGSPVIVPERGIRPGRGIHDPTYRRLALVGIMSGHWWEGEYPAMFRHSGLSYMTASPAILDLLKPAQAAPLPPVGE